MTCAGSLAASELRVDGLAVDIEATNIDDVPERTRRLVELSRELRAAIDAERPIAAITLSAVHVQVVNPAFWPGYPWAEIGTDLRPRDADGVLVDPQGRAARRGRYVGENIDRIRASTGRDDLPIHVIGGIADGVTPADLDGMVAALEARGAIGGSLYDWATSTAEQWRRLAAPPPSSATARPSVVDPLRSAACAPCCSGPIRRRGGPSSSARSETSSSDEPGTARTATGRGPGGPSSAAATGWRGGTWLAVDPSPDRPAVAALLNGFRATRTFRRRERPLRPTRGDLALRALAGDPLPAGPDLEAYDRFHLLLATAERQELWTWDAEALVHQVLTPGDHIVVNAGLDTDADPLVPHFVPLLAAVPDPDLDAGDWGGWTGLLSGDGLAGDDDRALVVRKEIEGRAYGSTSGALVALAADGRVRYDFTADSRRSPHLGAGARGRVRARDRRRTAHRDDRRRGAAASTWPTTSATRSSPRSGTPSCAGR